MNHPHYTFGGFSIRLRSGSKVRVSNHAFGMALDADPSHNPQLYKKPLFLISLITNTNLMAKSTPEEMKYANEQLQQAKINSQKMQSMKVGFEKIDNYHKKEGSFPVADFTKTFVHLNKLLEEVHNLRDRTIYLSNERNFTNNRTRYTEKQAKAIEQEFYQIIPQKCIILKQEISEKWDIDRIKEFVDVLRDGYNPAMRLSVLYPAIYEMLEQDIISLSNFAKVLQALDGIILATSSHQVRSDIASTIEEVNILTTSETSMQTLADFINLTIENYYNAFGSQSDFKELITWLENGKVYSFKSNRNLETIAFFEELSQIGFMRMSVDFVNEFLDNNTSGDEDVIDWGGYWTSKKDWMHLEYVESDRFMPK